MKNTTKKTGILVFLLLLCPSANATNHQCSSCSECTAKIASAAGGDVVYLNSSLIMTSAGNCITFNNKSGITLNCAGFSLSGAQGGYGIYLNRSSYNTIRNCMIISYTNGIYMYYSNNNTINGNTMILNQGSGLYALYSNWSTVKNNTASSNSANGFFVAYTSGFTLENNTAERNIQYGIQLYYANNVKVSLNNANNNSLYGLGFTYSSQNTVNANRFCDNSQDFQIYGNYSNSGDNNACGRPGPWNDTGTTGCTYSCTATTSSTSSTTMTTTTTSTTIKTSTTTTSSSTTTSSTTTSTTTTTSTSTTMPSKWDVSGRFDYTDWKNRTAQIWGRNASNGLTYYALLNGTEDNSYTEYPNTCSYDGLTHQYPNTWHIERDYINASRYYLSVRGRSIPDCGRGQPRNAGRISVNYATSWRITGVTKCTITTDTNASNGVYIPTWCTVNMTAGTVDWQSGSACDGCCYCGDGALVDINVTVDKTSNRHAQGDSNLDDVIDYADLVILAKAYGSQAGQAGYDSRADYNDDGSIDYKDLIIIAQYYGT